MIYRGWHLSGSVLLHMEAAQASDAAAQDVERSNGYLLEPFLLLLERPALVSHALLGLLDLRLDLAAALLDLAGHLQHVLEATLDLLRHVCTKEHRGRVRSFIVLVPSLTGATCLELACVCSGIYQHSN